MEKMINVGIVAHVDAGKTSLTEKLYSMTHKSYQSGSIKQANTVTDTLEIEKERGITIKSASVSLEWEHSKINILDMPGHIEFYGEVIRSLNVIDVAILVVSSVGELPIQTRRIFDTLKEAGIPTVFFINKVDLETARVGYIKDEIRKKLTNKLLPIEATIDGETEDLIIEQTPKLFDQFVEGLAINSSQLEQAKNELFLNQKLFPILEGSAVSGQGVKKLLNYLTTIELILSNNRDNSAYLYKVAFDNGQKQAFFKLVSGKIIKHQSYVLNQLDTIKMNPLFVLKDNQLVPVNEIFAGDIFMIPNKKNLKIGDTIGIKKINEMTLPKPTLKIIFEVQIKERETLLKYLSEMYEEDPLIDFSIDEKTSEVSVKIFGQVQREYIEETLRRRYAFKSLVISQPKIMYKEQPKKIAYGCIEAFENLNPYWATMTLKVEPNQGKGIIFDSLVTTGYLKQAFQNAIKEAVFEEVEVGLYDYGMIDTTITLTDAEFFSPVSTPSEFRKLTPYALYKALLKSETYIMEPRIAIDLTTHHKYLGKAVSELGRLEAVIEEVTELEEEASVRAYLNQSAFLDFEEQLNELFSNQAYLKSRVIDYTEVLNQELYQKGKVDRIKALLNKEKKKL